MCLIVFDLDYAMFASRWRRLFHALPADILAKPLVRSNFCCCFILLTPHMQISCCPCPYATAHKTERVHDTVFHFLFVSQGINSLLARGVYDSAFPLHDVSITEIATALDNVKVYLLKSYPYIYHLKMHLLMIFACVLLLLYIKQAG